MKIKVLVLLLLTGFQTSFTQTNPKLLLDKVSTTYSTGSGYVLSFTLNTEDTRSKTTYSHDGKAYLKGNKFKVDVPDGITWFDGKTQWVYMDGSDEVNVSNPSGEELAAISPVAILNLYKSGFKLNGKGEKTVNGKTVYEIEMVPQAKNSEIEKIILQIDKNTNLFTAIRMQGKDKVNNHLIINKQEKSNLPESTFVFNRNDYPGIEIIDLR